MSESPALSLTKAFEQAFNLVRTLPKDFEANKTRFRSPKTHRRRDFAAMRLGTFLSTTDFMPPAPAFVSAANGVPGNYQVLFAEKTEHAWVTVLPKATPKPANAETGQ